MITKDMVIREVIRQYPETINIFGLIRCSINLIQNSIAVIILIGNSIVILITIFVFRI